MEKQIKIAIITGGSSSERQVSLWSAETVINTLKTIHEIDIYDFPEDIDLFIKNRKDYKLVIPVFHGPGGEDGTIQGFLKTLNVPFLFSDTLPLAMSMNKEITKIIANIHGLNVINSSVLSKNNLHKIQNSVVVKPIDGGSTIGTSIANNQEEFEIALKNAFGYSNEVLVEDYIPGREFTVGILEEGNDIFPLPVTEIVSNGFFDFESKYVADKMANEICPADPSTELTTQIQDFAVKIHKGLKLKNLSRSDFILDADNKIWFLETNTIPGLTINSLWPKALKTSGRNLENVFSDWIDDVLDKSNKMY